ncbi:probable ATP-dependent RNA helicase DDX10 [Nilaparvata lugens]|uniref:probable ATP-dependent RNA helicase DDX10 n=1 Tax=Nilaparvata lugens TaxID=108931 RepID=UPI00193D3AE3|nr:probable ATP-dependent RNA helicase DDX10 [Nilaparvata lugens]
MKNSGNKNIKLGKKKVKIFKKKKKESIDEIIQRLNSSYNDIVPENISSFNDFPLSFNTQKGLRENDYTTPTEIQKQSIGYALQGNDILGAAKTGSGKTLAFLIPVLEVLFCKKWTTLDGLGALIITPTRELAYQIFETLRKVGRYHDFSAGLIIGGKDLHFEKKRMDQCNIVICTPGRLLHHMDENPLFDCVNLQILVLDEADNCLNMGFEETMNSIIANLPPNRQTLLFSATQTKSIRDLARLSLTNPKYLSVHENAAHSTPEELTQSYVVCEIEDKISNLWSFIKSHVKHKILVFFSTCKQVKYTFEMFCQLRPGIALLQLHGGMHQEKRMAMYRSFCSKKYAVLFATDIAARGLDFPEVNWVIQADCPEDATTYIHRVGRTARYFKGGEAVILLLPSEKDAMLQHLAEKKVPLQEIKINPLKLQNPRVKFEAILAKKPELKASAQRAFVTYLKSVFLMKDKKVFDIHKLNTDLYARSLGLVVSPRIRFLTKKEKLKKNDKKSLNGVDNDGSNLLDSIKKEEDSENSSDGESNEEKPKLDGDGKLKRSSFQTFNFEGGDSEDDDDDILKIKREDHDLEGSDEGEPLEIGPGRRQKKPVTKAALAKKALKKNIVPNKKTIFTEDGEVNQTIKTLTVTRRVKPNRWEREKKTNLVVVTKGTNQVTATIMIDLILMENRVKMMMMTMISQTKMIEIEGNSIPGIRTQGKA